jgi:hypothetical protein
VSPPSLSFLGKNEKAASNIFLPSPGEVYNFQPESLSRVLNQVVMRQAGGAVGCPID